MSIFKAVKALNMTTRLGFQPHFSGPRMGLQTLAMRQHRGNLPQGLGALLAHLNQAGAFLEVVHAQRR